MNRNKIVSLVDGVRNPVDGELISLPAVEKANLGGPTVRLVKDGTMGDIYVNRDWKRDRYGMIEVIDGVPSMETLSTGKSALCFQRPISDGATLFHGTAYA